MEKLKQVGILSFILFLVSYGGDSGALISPTLAFLNSISSSMGRNVNWIISDDAPVDGNSCWKRSYDAILKLEGGRSNHKNDRGGLTYRGITTRVSQRVFGQPDPTKLTKSQIQSIYKTEYWDKSGAGKHPWPLCLAIYNSYVNSGRKWQISKTGTAYEKAIHYLNQQRDYYYAIVKRDKSQNVFLRGWLNRDKKLRQIFLEP